MNRVNSRNGSAMMTAPLTLSLILYYIMPHYGAGSPRWNIAITVGTETRMVDLPDSEKHFEIYRYVWLATIQSTDNWKTRTQAALCTASRSKNTSHTRQCYRYILYVMLVWQRDAVDRRRHWTELKTVRCDRRTQMSLGSVHRTPAMTNTLLESRRQTVYNQTSQCTTRVNHGRVTE